MLSPGRLASTGRCFLGDDPIAKAELDADAVTRVTPPGRVAPWTPPPAVRQAVSGPPRSARSQRFWSSRSVDRAGLLTPHRRAPLWLQRPEDTSAARSLQPRSVPLTRDVRRLIRRAAPPPRRAGRDKATSGRRRPRREPPALHPPNREPDSPAPGFRSEPGFSPVDRDGPHVPARGVTSSSGSGLPGTSRAAESRPSCTWPPA
jgi:hypothetical protein